MSANASGAKKSLDAVDDKLNGMVASANVAGSAVDSFGDEATSAAGKATALARTGKMAAKSVENVGNNALTASAKMGAFGAAMTGVSIASTAASGSLLATAAAIGAVGLAMAPIAVGALGIAAAFGAIVGSGIYAGMDRLKNSFKQAMAKIKPMIKAFGEQFVPMLDKAIQALPGLVRSVLNALGPMDQFKSALKTLGRMGARLLPKLIGFAVDIGRKMLPVFMDMAKIIEKNAVPALKTIVNWGLKLWNALDKLAPSVKTVKNFVKNAIGFIRSLVEQFRQGANQGEGLRKKFTDLKNALQTFWEKTKPTRKALAKLGTELSETAGLVFGMAMDVATLAIKLRAELSPIISTIINSLTTLVRWFNDGLKAVRSLGKQVATESSKMDKAWKKVDRLADRAKKTFTQIKVLIRKALRYVKNKVIKPLLKNIKELWKTHGEEIKKSINQLLSFILTAFKGLKKTVKWIWSVIGEEVMAAVNLFTTIVVQTITQFTDSILTLFDVFTDILAGDWKGAWNAIKGFLKRTVDRLSKIVDSLVNYLTTAISGLVDAIFGFFEWLYNKLIGGSIIPKMINGIIGAFESFAQDIVSTVEGIVNDITDWFGKLPGKLGRFVSDFMQTGKDFIQGIIDGIGNMASDLANKAKQTAEDAANGLINKFNQILPDSLSVPEVTLGGMSIEAPEITIGEGVPGPDYTIGGQTLKIPSASFGGQNLNIPQLDVGGEVEETGLAQIHEGETIVPAKVDRGYEGGGGDTYVGGVNVEVYGDADGREVATEVSAELRSVFNH